ncbi:MAG: hypothetical protein ABFS86_18790, partial [Planctomycetota bacterium]
NPDAKWRKAAKGHRRKRAFPWHILIAIAALVIVGGGFLWYVATPPSPEDEIAAVVPAFLESWGTLDDDELFRVWFDGDFTMLAKLRRIFRSKGWTAKRPPLTLRTTEISPTKTGARTDFHPAGAPGDALVKIYWVKSRHGLWRVRKAVLVRVPDAAK